MSICSLSNQEVLEALRKLSENLLKIRDADFRTLTIANALSGMIAARDPHAAFAFWEVLDDLFRSLEEDQN